MASEDIQATVEKLSEALVLCDPTDLPALADLHTLLEDVQGAAEAEGRRRCAEFAAGAADRIEGIILQEEESPDAVMEWLAGVTAGFQQVFRDGKAEEEVQFEQASPAQEEGDLERRFNIELPSYVDEQIFGDFLARQVSVLDEMEELVLAFEMDNSEDTMAALRRLIHTLKGESAMLGLADIERLCHVAEDGLTGDAPSAGVNTDNLLSLRDWLKRAFDSCAGKGEAPEAPDRLLALLKNEAVPESPAAAPSEPAAAPQAAAAPVPQAPEADPDLVFEARPLEGDRELLNDFIIEANEHLETADVQLLTLETDPNDEDAINAVFRGFHTIKGVAGFLALDEVQALAHEAENLLDQSRKGQVVLADRKIDLVFESIDVLKRCIESVSNALSTGEALQPQPETPRLVTDIRAVLAGGKAPAPAAPPKPAAETGKGPKLGEILVDSGTASEKAVEEAIFRQNIPPDKKKIGAILIEGAVTSSRRVNEAMVFQHTDAPEKKLGAILVEMGAVSEQDVEKAAMKQQEPAKPAKLGETLVRSGESSARDVAQGLRAQRSAAQGGPSGSVQVREAVKVDANRLDLLVDMIGELVIAESMVAQSPELRDNLSTNLERHIGQLDKITRELQVTAMSLRMVPIRATFQKMARLVRDLSKKTGKAVEFHMSGEDTELDKTVVDKIGDPLVHMVRNAVDHGLEDTSDERRASGKEPAGQVWLRAFHEGGNIHIQIEDDGRGLPREKILAKALEKGVISSADNLSDREINNLIFAPGFSTAKEITEVSGRGVGMDVVKRNIEALRGKVEIASKEGKGSVFTIQLPLTLAIIDGMVVRVGKERYIIPTLSIVISLRPEQSDVNTVAGKGEMLSLQGRLIPLFRLYRTFGLEGALQDLLEGTIIVVEHDNKKAGILVDEILGQQQIVIKSLGESLKGVPGIAGGAIMPDGRVGLILDIASLVRLAGENAGRKDGAAAGKA
jgi:two-component system, chemotaxis family, sensor kinase CheA